MKTLLKKITVSILTWEAKRTLERYKPKIIAVTGSVGKTGTKDAIYAVVSNSFDTRRSEKSMNSDIGLPLAILGLENAWSSAPGWLWNMWRGVCVAFGNRAFPDWLLLEVGTDHPGDIEKISGWLRPDIVVLTCMSEVPVHVEFFKDAEEVLREKMFLARALKPGGTLVINADDRLFINAAGDLPVKKLFYGREKKADVKIIETGILYSQTPPDSPLGQYTVMEIKGQKQKIKIEGVIGGHIMYSVAAACAVASILNIADDLPNVFKHIDLPRGRMRLFAGISKSVIIDDTYNSSPIASEEALKTLQTLSAKGKKIAVLGDMKELGKHSEKAHRDIGRLAGEFVHILVTMGNMAQDFAQGAREAGLSAERIFSYDTSEEAVQKLPDMVRADDIILIKGSQATRMERVVKALLKDPSKATNLLVRQEEEWKCR
ncbi:MAG: UDP-N-acetylmuramoyl-tripeptide--D-alanyl-D-alanine ligase [Patescibacteria group bacterium]